MASDVKLRFKRPHPGSGFDSAGNPKQGKVEVVGRIEVTSYNQGGEDLKPSDVGLSVIDWIDIKHENQSGDSKGTTPRIVNYNFGVQQFYIVEDAAGVFEAANAGTHNLRFHATGDSSSDVELL
jgi:hypothetical protein